MTSRGAARAGTTLQGAAKGLELGRTPLYSAAALARAVRRMPGRAVRSEVGVTKQKFSEGPPPEVSPGDVARALTVAFGKPRNGADLWALDSGAEVMLHDEEGVAIVGVRTGPKANFLRQTIRTRAQLVGFMGTARLAASFARGADPLPPGPRPPNAT